MKKVDIAIVGGGFYGCCLAVELASKGKSVLVIERESRLLSRASYVNQARVHGGYHYPRSFLTGARSRENFQLFVDAFEEAIVRDFTKLYAIAKNSKVTANQFSEFCQRINAPVKVASSLYSEMFSHENIEQVFEVQEYAFNSKILASIVHDRMKNLGVQIFLDSSIEKIKQHSSPEIVLEGVHKPETIFEVTASEVYLVTYSGINEALAKSNLSLLPLRHELTEIVLVKVPRVLQDVSTTVMDGPFWSLMPFPTRPGLSSLTHVRYTPHYKWSEENNYEPLEARGFNKKTAFNFMVKDAARFLPIMADVSYEESLWEVKTVLPRSDDNDSRPILFQKNYGFTGLHIVLGGKLDNVFDVFASMNQGNK